MFSVRNTLEIGTATVFVFAFKPRKIPIPSLPQKKKYPFFKTRSNISLPFFSRSSKLGPSLQSLFTSQTKEKFSYEKILFNNDKQIKFSNLQISKSYLNNLITIIANKILASIEIMRKICYDSHEINVILTS